MSQKLEVGHKYALDGFLGLNDNQTTFTIEPLETFKRAGYLLDLEDDHIFRIYGYFFCGVGEKAYVEGTYQFIGDHQIQLNFERTLYKDMGQETRREENKKTQTYRYNLADKTFQLME